MEDRFNFGQYLEMTEASETAVAARAQELLHVPEVKRVTWWQNVNRDRPDLPRVLPEFERLLVAEVGVAFRVPNPSHGFTPHNFVRTNRPGQGTLSGKPTIGLSLVLISPREDHRAQELRDWADFIHIRHIAEAAVPGYTMITPYVNAEQASHPRFMHFYEMDCNNPEQSYKMMTPMVTARLGGADNESWKSWAFGPSLRIMYVNTFRRIGELIV